MAITSYTTYSEIRAVCGLSSKELTDETLGLSVYDLGLKTDLLSIGTSLPATFAAINALNEADRTESQQTFFDMVRLYAPYVVAKQLKPALPMLGPKEVTDGKAGFSRFADSPYRTTIKNIDDEYDRLRPLVEAAYSAVTASSYSPTVLTVFAAVGQATNRITG